MLDAPYLIGVVVMKILERLDDLIQDDGNVHVYLTEYGYAEEERDRLVCWLLDKEGVITEERIRYYDMERFTRLAREEWNAGIVYVKTCFADSGC